MDKKAWIAIALSVIGLVLWNVFIGTSPPLPVPPVAGSASPAAAASPSPEASPIFEPARHETLGGEKPAPPPAAVPERFETLSLPQMTVRFTSLGGGIADVTLLGKQHLAEDGQQIRLNGNGIVPIGALSAEAGNTTQARDPYEVRKEGDAVICERVIPGQVKITKKFSVLPAPSAGDLPALSLEITYTNIGTQPFKSAGDFIYAGSAAPIHRRDQATYTECAWLRDGKVASKDVTYFEPGYVPVIGRMINAETHPAPVSFTQDVDKAAWLGVKNQFYTTILAFVIPPGPDGAAPDFPSREVWAKRFDLPAPADESGAIPPPAHGINAALGLQAMDLGPAKSQTVAFQIYAGPTQFARLSHLGHDEEEILKYGTFTRPVSIFLLRSMNWLKSKLGNYVLAIMVLTICIKLILYPLQARANQSARKMAALAPKMTELRDRYKDDPTRAQSETLKLYKDYGINPLGGCWPALIQMPIFFGFFRMLGTAAELRNSGFLWVHDLSQPDTVAHFAGWNINVLPLLMAGTMLWQMTLTPKTGDASQQRMMMMVPLVFVLFCYNFAAALSLYYTMQNLLTIGQLYLTRRQPAPILVKRTPGSDKGGRGLSLLGSNGKKNPKQRVRL